MKSIISLMAVLLFLGFSAGAKAQQEEISKDWSIRAGFFIPQRGAASDKGGNVWPTFGAEHILYNTNQMTTTFSMDYYGSGNMYAIPFQLNLRSEKNRLRMGVGAGYSVGHDLDRGVNAVSFSALIGYTISQGLHPIALDVRYLGTTNASEELNGVAFTIGIQY